MCETLTCALHVHHRHICAWQQKPQHLQFMFGENQVLTFKKYNLGPLQTMKYRICDLFGVRTYVSRERIHYFSNISETTKHTYFSHLAL